MFIVRQGLAPTESFEIAKADMIVDGLEALMEKCVKFYTEKDEEIQVTLLETTKTRRLGLRKSLIEIKLNQAKAKYV